MATVFTIAMSGKDGKKRKAHDVTEEDLETTRVLKAYFAKKNIAFKDTAELIISILNSAPFCSTCLEEGDAVHGTHHVCSKCNVQTCGGDVCAAGWMQVTQYNWECGACHSKV